MWCYKSVLAEILQAPYGVCRTRYQRNAWIFFVKVCVYVCVCV